MTSYNELPPERGPSASPKQAARPAGARRAAFAALAVLAAVIGAVVGWRVVDNPATGVSASGASTSGSAPDGAGGSTASGSATLAATGPPSGGTGTGAGATATGPAHCLAGQLSYQAGSSSAAAGTVNVGIKVVNSGSKPCWTFGYPGLEIIDAGGTRLPTTTLRGADSPFQGPLTSRLRNVPARVVLAAGSWGWFELAYSDVPASDCPSGPVPGSTLGIIAPDTTAQRTVPLSTQACGGRLGVSPILPASTWTS